MVATIVRFLAAALVGWAVLAVLAVAAQTQFVLERLAAQGAPITPELRLTSSLRDLQGLGPTYAALLAGPFVILTALAQLLGRITPALRLPLYLAAGAATPVLVLVAAEAAFGVPPITGASDLPGYAAQAAAGALGGLIAALLAPRPLKR